MFNINEDEEILINGQTINELTKNGSSTVKKNVVINNDKVIQNDFENMEDIHNDLIVTIAPDIQHLKKLTKLKCSYCGSVYKSSKEKCPSCVASYDSI